MSDHLIIICALTAWFMIGFLYTAFVCAYDPTMDRVTPDFIVFHVMFWLFFVIIEFPALTIVPAFRFTVRIIEKHKDKREQKRKLAECRVIKRGD